MGADGHMVVVKREDWDRNCPGVAPSDLGLYEGTILSTSAVWGYYGDNLFGCGHNDWNNFGELFTDDKEERKRQQKALAWFDSNAEWHEVWT